MDTILPFIQSATLSEENLILIMVLLSSITIVVAVFLIATGSRTALRRRLDTLSVPAQDTRKEALSNKLDSISPFLTPKNAKERQDVRLRLIQAGFHHESAVSYFYAIKIFAMFLGLIIAALYYLFSGSDSSLLIVAGIGAGLGMFLPNIFLSRLVQKRQSRIKRGVPDALDLLVVCTESGLGLNLALNRVAKELFISHPDLSDELDMVCLKIKAGYEMPLAFKDMVERTGVSELSGLVGMLSHASKMGGSLAQTLRDYTEDYRDKRNQEVEEIAAKIPTKMVFPMLVCIWPAFFIVVVGPAALGLIDTFSSLGN